MLPGRAHQSTTGQPRDRDPGRSVECGRDIWKDGGYTELVHKRDEKEQLQDRNDGHLYLSDVLGGSYGPTNLPLDGRAVWSMRTIEAAMLRERSAQLLGARRLWKVTQSRAIQHAQSNLRSSTRQSVSPGNCA